jgi:hypothetical protein
VCVLAVLSSIVTLGAGLGAQTPARDVIAKPTTGTATIAGTVVTDEQNSRPIRRVTVLLSIPGNAPSVPRVTATDDAGRFVFTRLPAGNYSAPRATRLGYVPVTYGEKRTGGIGTPITLAEGQQFMIAMKMLRGAVITGTVFDEGNRPAARRVRRLGDAAAPSERRRAADHGRRNQMGAPATPARGGIAHRRCGAGGRLSYAAQTGPGRRVHPRLLLGND